LLGHSLRAAMPRSVTVTMARYDFLCPSYTEFILAPHVRMTPRASHVACLTERASELERAE